MKIIKRQLNVKEVLDKIKMITCIEVAGNFYKIWLNDGWIWGTHFFLQPASNEIRCAESALEKVMEFIREYEKVYQEEYEKRLEITIIYDGGK